MIPILRTEKTVQYVVVDTVSLLEKGKPFSCQTLYVFNCQQHIAVDKKKVVDSLVSLELEIFPQQFILFSHT